MPDSAYVEPANGFHGVFAQLKQLNIYEGEPADLYGPDLADFYNRFVGDFVKDIPLFERLLPRPHGRVLDLACGSGRIGVGLSRLGVAVDGLELSPAMLALVERNLAAEQPEVKSRLRFFEGDMTAFDLPDRYDLIVLGVTSISLLLEAEQRQSMFAHVRKHLAEGGRFVFDILDLSGDRWRTLDHHLDVWSTETDEGVDFALIGQRFDPQRRQFTFNIYRELAGWSGETRRTIGSSTKAWLDREQLEPELSAAGLEIIDEFNQDLVKYFVTQAAQPVF